VVFFLVDRMSPVAADFAFSMLQENRSRIMDLDALTICITMEGLGHGDLAKSNGELVEKAVQLATGVSREIATPEEARKILGVRGSPS